MSQASMEPSWADILLRTMTGSSPTQTTGTEGQPSSPGADTWMPIMAMGTQLGGAIAGKDTVVGDVSAALNNVAQQSIMSANAQKREQTMTDLLQRNVSALTGGNVGGEKEKSALSLPDGGFKAPNMGSTATATGGTTASSVMSQVDQIAEKLKSVSLY